MKTHIIESNSRTHRGLANSLDYWLFLPLLFAAVPCIVAQPFDLHWSTLDGGGGIATGGVFVLRGSTGQADAGTLNGGNYRLVGGFWGIIAAVQTPEAPLLAVVRDPVSGEVTLSWSLPGTGLLLTQASALASPTSATTWSPLSPPYQTNATRISIKLPSPVGNRFYRLHKP